MSMVEKKSDAIKIIYEPFKEIVIKEYTRFDRIEDLVYIFAQLRAGGAPLALSWANGIVFVYSPIPPDSDQLIDEFLKGRIYWANVSFADMPQYKQVLETKEKIQVPVINTSSNATFSQVTEWLKNQS
jgi:hypothetical protein